MITPDFIGQIYKDTTNGNLWRANSLTPGDWTLEVQNTGMLWTPRANSIMDVVVLATEKDWGNLPLENITAVSFEIGPQSIFVNDADQLITFSAPNADFQNGQVRFQACAALTTINISGATEINGPLYIQTCPLITSLNFSSLQTCYSFLSIGNTSLTSLSFPSLVDVFDHITIANNTSLTTINLGAEFPDNGKNYTLNNNALNAATVNSVLALLVAEPSYVSGTVLLNGGTNAAPSGQGIADKATLIGRGVTVTTN